MMMIFCLDFQAYLVPEKEKDHYFGISLPGKLLLCSHSLHIFWRSWQNSWVSVTVKKQKEEENTEKILRLLQSKQEIYDCILNVSLLCILYSSPSTQQMLKEQNSFTVATPMGQFCLTNYLELNKAPSGDKKWTQKCHFEWWNEVANPSGNIMVLENNSASYF